MNEITTDDFSDIEVDDQITMREKRFPYPMLLELDYFKRRRLSWYRCREVGAQQPIRNYFTLLQYLSEIHEYREDDAKAFVKRFRDDPTNTADSEAAFAEVIVYRYYIRPVHEGIIRSVRLGRKECDIIITRLDGSEYFLEVFSVTPHFPESETNEPVVRSYATHRQEALASIRQKILRKINVQKQMSKPRENWAVIELNDVSIAGDFAVLSSLSDGYKVTIDMTTNKAVASGYDWSKSIFNDEATKWLRGVIWFDLGDYESRRMLQNPFYGKVGDLPVADT